MPNLLEYLKKLHRERKKELLLILPHDTVSQNLYHIWLQLGFWASTHIRKLLWPLTQLILRLTLVVECVILWVQTRIKRFFQMLVSKLTVNLPVVGELTITVSTLLLVLVVLLQAGALIYL